MMKNFLPIRLTVTIFLVSTGFYLALGNQESCICELDNTLNCTKFRCPIDKCGDFSSSYNFTCLCEKKTDRITGCQTWNFMEVVQNLTSCNEHHPFICSDSNNKFQIYAEENKTWTEAVRACKERNSHIAYEYLSTINHTSNLLFWIGKFIGQVSNSNLNVSQNQMRVDIPEMNSTSALYATCEIQSEMIRLTTTSMSPTSPTANLTTEPTPDINETFPVTIVNTTDTTPITTNYGSTEGPSSTEKEASIDVSFTSSSHGSTSPPSPVTNKITTETSKTSSTESTTNYERTGWTSSTEQESVSSPSETSASPLSTTTSYIPTSPKVTITSSLPESHLSTSTFVDSTTTNHGNRTETPTTINQTESSATTSSADLSTLSTIKIKSVSVTNTNTESTVSNTVVKPNPRNEEQEKQDETDSTPILAGALSGGAVLIIIGVTVLYIRHRRNQNKTKRPMKKASGITRYNDRSLRGKSSDHLQSQNPIYLPPNESHPVHGNHGPDTLVESDDENNYDHFDKTKAQNGIELQNDTYDHARLDTQAESTYGYGVLNKKKDGVIDDVYDHTGALTEGTYGHLHQKDETSQPDSDTYDTSRL